MKDSFFLLLFKLIKTHFIALRALKSDPESLPEILLYLRDLIPPDTVRELRSYYYLSFSLVFVYARDNQVKYIPTAEE